MREIAHHLFKLKYSTWDALIIVLVVFQFAERDWIAGAAVGFVGLTAGFLAERWLDRQNW